MNPFLLQKSVQLKSTKRSEDILPKMEKKPFKFTHKKQFEYLYTTMEENLHIARGNALTSPDENDLSDFWENLAQILNKIGPLHRSASGWLKIWNEHKAFILKKIQYCPSSEDEPKKVIFLTDLEKGVAQIITPRSFRIIPASSTDINPASSALARVNEGLRRISAVSSSNNNRMANHWPAKIPESAKDTIIQIQEQTQKYLQRMTKIEEERLRIEKKELEEKIKFRAELALLVQKVQSDIMISNIDG